MLAKLFGCVVIVRIYYRHSASDVLASVVNARAARLAEANCWSFAFYRLEWSVRVVY